MTADRGLLGAEKVVDLRVNEMRSYVNSKVKNLTTQLNLTLLKCLCRCLLSIVKKFPTRGNANGPGGKFGGFLFFR